MMLKIKNNTVCGFWVILFLSSLNSFGQPEVDSLLKQLDNARYDSVKVDLLIKLSQAYEYADYVKSRAYADESMQLAEKIESNWAKGESYVRIAFLETREGDHASALKYDNLSLESFFHSKDSSKIAFTLNAVGTDYRELGEYDNAYAYLTRSYQVARKMNDSLTMCFALHNIGVVFKELGHYEIAINHLNLSQAISDKINDVNGIAYCNDELGDVYLGMKDFIQSEKYLRSALAHARIQKISVLIPRIQSHLADLYYEMNDWDKSVIYYDSVYAIHKELGNPYGIAQCELGKGKVLLKLERFSEAAGLFERTLKSAQELGARNLEIASYRALADLSELNGDYKKAVVYFKNFTVLRDSLFSQKMMGNLFQDQLRFETEIKDSEIAALSQAKAKQDSAIRRQEFIRNILVVVVALAGILLFTIYRSGQRRKRINKLLLEHQEEIKQRSIELEQLNQVKDKFFSIISHDLRSPMNALLGILNLLENKQLKPEEFTQLTKELRIQFNHTKTLIGNLLDWALLQMDKLKIVPEKINLRTMVEDNFKMLNSLHLKETNLVNQIQEGSVALADMNMINLIFRNLILNGIKFTENGGQITVSAKDDGSEYTVAIADNGVGISEDIQKILFEKTTGYSSRGTANEKGTGLGLILCKEFVEKNGGKIWLKSEPGKGSTFYFTVKKAK